MTGTRRLRLLVVFATVALVLTAAWMATRSPLLDVDEVVVRGADRLTADEVLAAAEVKRGDALVWLDPERAEARVEALPWVRRARVERELPDTLRITIAERRVVAWFDAGNGAASLVDRTGHVLATDPGAPAGVPQLLGVAPGTPVGGTVTPTEGARVAGMLDGFVQAGSRAVEVVDGRVTIVIASGQEIRMGEPTQIAAKIRAAARGARCAGCGGQALRRRERTVHPGGRRCVDGRVAREEVDRRLLQE